MVVRVFPSCELVGTFHVRGRAGINRVPFRGRLHGRPLASGTYRLLIGARRFPSAVTTIVVAHGKISAGKLRKARRANACVPVLPIGFNATAPSLPTSGVASRASGGTSSQEGIATAIVIAAKGAVKEGKELAGRTKQTFEDPEPVSALVFVVIVLLALMVAGLGTLLVVDLYKQRERVYR